MKNLIVAAGLCLCLCCGLVSGGCATIQESLPPVIDVLAGGRPLEAGIEISQNDTRTVDGVEKEKDTKTYSFGLRFGFSQDDD